jgi:hypothetical protein
MPAHPKALKRPEHRANLIRRVHQDVGHYGVKKMYSLLKPTYWWVDMFGQVQHEVAACTVCDQAKVSFEVKDPQLSKPLPIMGMYYRWRVDSPVQDAGHVQGRQQLRHRHDRAFHQMPGGEVLRVYRGGTQARTDHCVWCRPAEVLIDQGETVWGGVCRASRIASAGWSIMMTIGSHPGTTRSPMDLRSAWSRPLRPLYVGTAWGVCMVRWSQKRPWGKFCIF